jgi:DNA end-binding protein Ku
MRYAEELRDPAKYFDQVKKVTVDADQLSLAMEIIKKKTAKFNADDFTDEYEKALRELVKAKMQHRPIPQEEPAQKTGKVINLMDALRQSVHSGKPPRATRGAASRSGLTLVKPAKSTKRKAS